MIKAPTFADSSCIAIVLLLFYPSPVILYQPVLLVNLDWLLNDLRIDFKRICHYLIQSLLTAFIDVFILLGLADVIYLYRV